MEDTRLSALLAGVKGIEQKEKGSWKYTAAGYRALAFRERFSRAAHTVIAGLVLGASLAAFLAIAYHPLENGTGIALATRKMNLESGLDSSFATAILKNPGTFLKSPSTGGEELKATFVASSEGQPQDQATSAQKPSKNIVPDWDPDAAYEAFMEKFGGKEFMELRMGDDREFHNLPKFKLCFKDRWASKWFSAPTIESFENLTHLNLDGKDLEDSGSRTVAKHLFHLTQLTSMSFREDRITDAGAAALAYALPGLKHLRQLSFEGNLIGPAGGRELLRALARMSFLSFLGLERNQLGDEGAEALAEVMPNLVRLVRLYLDHNRIGGAGARAVAKALPHHETLELLSLHDNPIGDEGAKALASTLSSLVGLTTFSLARCQIGPRGIEALAQVLPRLKNLQNLDLEGNDLGDAGAKALAQVLVSMDRLQQLELDKTSIGDAGAKALADALKNHRALYTLSLRQNPMGEAGGRALVGNLQQVKNLQLDKKDYGTPAPEPELSKLEAYLQKRHMGGGMPQQDFSDLRRSDDNLYYTAHEFHTHFGKLDEWNAAPQWDASTGLPHDIDLSSLIKMEHLIMEGGQYYELFVRGDREADGDVCLMVKVRSCVPDNLKRPPSVSPKLRCLRHEVQRNPVVWQFEGIHEVTGVKSWQDVDLEANLKLSEALEEGQSMVSLCTCGYSFLYDLENMRMTCLDDHNKFCMRYRNSTDLYNEKELKVKEDAKYNLGKTHWANQPLTSDILEKLRTVACQSAREIAVKKHKLQTIFHNKALIDGILPPPMEKLDMHSHDVILDDLLSTGEKPDWLIEVDPNKPLAADLPAKLAEYGFLVFRGLVKPEYCQNAVTWIKGENAKVSFEQAFDLWHSVRQPWGRIDLKLKLVEPVRAVLETATTKLKGFLTNVLGRQAELAELSCMTALQGGERQMRHSDTHHAEVDQVNYGLAYSLFVALQNVTYEMGPTLTYPKSHTAEFHKTLKKEEKNFGESNKAVDKLLKGWQGIHHTLRQGDALIYDSRLFHCGGGNTSPEQRLMMVITWISEKIEGRVKPYGSTYSMRDELQGKITLDMQLQEYSKIAHMSANS